MQRFWIFLISLASLGFGLGSIAVADDKQPAVSFVQDVKPILQMHCVACHGGVKNAGDLKLTDRQSAMMVIEAGDATASSLYERVIATDESERMPPAEHGPALTPQQTDTLKRWIDQGANWEPHWAFNRPQRSPPPSLASPLPQRDPLDAWIAHAWPSHGALEPAEQALPREWLRRVTLALTGLPPTLEQSERFVQAIIDDPSQAYESTVDQLLASPAFGEHWATVWLDQVRYADSRGLGQDGPRVMWKYRDWVVQAFNEDLPFDQFTRMQLAGDLQKERRIEDSIATAVHRLTQTNEEGGTDDEEFRVAAVVDRINTIWQVWQGMTFGCVQCHDHPYDPFRHEEYYAFMSYFNNTADWDLDEEFPLIQVPLDRRDYATASQLDRRIRELNESIWEKEFDYLRDESFWQPIAGMQVSSNRTKVVVDETHANELHTQGTVQRNTDFIIEWSPQTTTTLSALRLTIKPLEASNALLNTEVGAVLSQIELQSMDEGQSEWTNVPLARLVVDEPEPFLNPNESLNAKSQTGFGAYARLQHPRAAAVLLQTPIQLNPNTKLQLKIAHRMFILDAFPLVSKRLAIDMNLGPELLEQLQAEDLETKRKALRELQDERRKIPSVTLPVVRELTPHLQRPTHVFLRGFFLTKDQQVQSALPHTLAPDDQPPTRLELAEWFVNDTNPLTARVHVNRIWSRLFGRGLVVTEEDFGSSGESPSHPELLDELATRFQFQYGWSQKRLIRDIVLSKTFGRSSHSSLAKQAADPDNAWLARGPRMRLPAEVIRDSALAMARLLNSKQGGPPTHPPIPAGVWQPFQAGDKWNTPDVGKADRYRRSLYTYTKRSIPYPMLASFDAPTREFCTSRRMPSNTPVQALMTLNDVTFLEASQGIADAVLENQADMNEQTLLALLWQWIIGRPAEPQELEHLAEYYRLSLKDGEPRQALAQTALLLLNHDEVFSN